jgi:hypothetical protein
MFTYTKENYKRSMMWIGGESGDIGAAEQGP